MNKPQACDYYPCRNDGICYMGDHPLTDETEDHWCACRVGFSGKNCESKCEY